VDAVLRGAQRQSDQLEALEMEVARSKEFIGKVRALD
jgi:hypothetical protein